MLLRTTVCNGLRTKQRTQQLNGPVLICWGLITWLSGGMLSMAAGLVTQYCHKEVTEQGAL